MTPSDDAVRAGSYDPNSSLDPREAMAAIVGLSAGFDDAGSLGPKEPLSWETVGRMAIDYARAGLRSYKPPAIAAPSDDAVRARTRLLAFVREHAPGGCKMLSLGDACICPLCDVDTLAALAAHQSAAPSDDAVRALIAEHWGPPEMQSELHLALLTKLVRAAHRSAAQEPVAEYLQIGPLKGFHWLRKPPIIDGEALKLYAAPIAAAPDGLGSFPYTPNELRQAVAAGEGRMRVVVNSIVVWLAASPTPPEAP